MINFNDVTKESIKGHNINWPQIPDHLYKILVTGGSVSGKPNSLPNLINHQQDIDEIYLYTKDLNKAKHQFLIKKCENVGTKLLFMIWMLKCLVIKNFKPMVTDLFIKDIKHFSCFDYTISFCCARKY